MFKCVVSKRATRVLVEVENGHQWVLRATANANTVTNVLMTFHASKKAVIGYV